MKLRLRYRLIIQIAATALLIAFFLYSMDLPVLAAKLQDLKLDRLAFLVLLLIPGFLIRAYRWQMLFNDGRTSVSLRDAVLLLFVGLGLNLFLPASSGDVAKSFFAYRWSGVKERMLSISLFDKIIALGSIAFVGIPASLYAGQVVYAVLSLLVLAPVIALVLMPVLVHRFRFMLRLFNACTRLARGRLDFLQIIRELKIPPAKLLYAIILSILGWLITYGQLYLSFRCIGADIRVLYVFSVAPFLTLARLFPFALNGLGTDEMAMYFFFHQAGLALETIIAAAIIYRLIVLLLPGFLGLWVIMYKKAMVVRREQT